MSETLQLATRAATAEFERIPEAAREVAKQALLDYIGVTIAGMQEPLARILLAQALEDGGNPQAALFGVGQRLSVPQAALVNGAAGHAHDYDDVHNDMIGHPTVPVAPAVFALGEHLNSSGRDVLNAFTTGVDTECIIANYAGPTHYRKGWHSTATYGTFGAAAASAVLLGLDAEHTARALGIAGTQAAGLKSQFGTMCKPLHAGHAANTGVQSARLAQRGFTSRTGILEAEQGFMETQAPSHSDERFQRAMQTDSYCQDILFKYHAACYLTHSAIEATNELCESNVFDPRQIQAVSIEVDPGHLRVCNIQEPSTGLEAKFSLRFTTAMAITGTDTSNIDTFTDELTGVEELVHYRDLVQVSPHAEDNADTVVTVVTSDGKRHRATANVAIPNRDLEAQWRKLENKFRALVAPRLGEDATSTAIEFCRTMEHQQDLHPLINVVNRIKS